jgi:hypothetical protein
MDVVTAKENSRLIVLKSGSAFRVSKNDGLAEPITSKLRQTVK